jgi:hypothetical protein
MEALQMPKNSTKRFSTALCRKFLTQELDRIGFTLDTSLADNEHSIYRSGIKYVHAMHYAKYGCWRLQLRFGIFNEMAHEMITVLSPIYGGTLSDPKWAPTYNVSLAEMHDPVEWTNGVPSIPAQRESGAAEPAIIRSDEPAIIQSGRYSPALFLSSNPELAGAKIAKSVQLHSAAYELLDSVPAMLPTEQVPWFLRRGLSDLFVMLALAIEKGKGAEQLQCLRSHVEKMMQLPSVLPPDNWPLAFQVLEQFVAKHKR